MRAAALRSAGRTTSSSMAFMLALRKYWAGAWNAQRAASGLLSGRMGFHLQARLGILLRIANLLAASSLLTWVSRLITRLDAKPIALTDIIFVTLSVKLAWRKKQREI